MISKKLAAAIVIVALLFSLTAYADSYWECAGCHRKIPEVLGDVCPYCWSHHHHWEPATCTAPETCICGETRGMPLGHSWREATCVDPKTCQVCGAQEGEAAGHRWNTGTVTREADCVSEGVRHVTCTVCGTESDIAIPMDPQRHVGGVELRGQKNATCTAKGYTGDTYCLGCDAKISDGETIPAIEHQWGERTELVQPTCVTPGTIQESCSLCGQVRTQVVSKDPVRHVRTAIRNRKNATCDAEGYTGDTYCVGCDEIISEGEAVARLEHQWDEGQVIRSATCAEEGKVRYTCKLCQATRDQTIPRNPAVHSGGTEMRNPKEAGDFSEGYTGDTYCLGCGQKISDGEKIPAKCVVGAYVTFGSYPQTEDGGELPIEWLVIDKDDTKALLISRYGLDAQPYHVRHVNVTWERSSIRAWLNGPFFQKAFRSEEERARILSSALENHGNNGVDGGNDTKDRVFLLNYAEGKSLLKKTADRVCVPTAYAILQGVHVEQGKGDWWLRSIASNTDPVADRISFAGRYGSGEMNEHMAVRPALWISLNP